MNRSAKAVVAGWFSYAHGHATGGDLFARDVLCEWLDELAIEHVTAFAPPFVGGPSLDSLDAAEFTHAFFVCGPFGRGTMEADFLSRFAPCRLIGINLSADFDAGQWQPFDLLIERDSAVRTKPDLSFVSKTELPPVIGLCLREPHPKTDVATANAAVGRLLERHGCARVAIDTRLDDNQTGLRSKDEVEAVISRMNAVVTTRLHGVVLALKNGVPALAVDAVPGGGKVSRQCAKIEWPNLLRLDELDDERLDNALAFALSEEARSLARECAARAREGVGAVRAQLVQGLTGSELDDSFRRRQTDEGLRAFLASIEPVESSPPSSWRRRLRRGLRQAFG